MATPERASTNLAPGFLVASPRLADPNFARSLVLMATHAEEGALGFVVNRPAPITVGEVLEQVDERLRRTARAAGRDGGPVLLGGPVRPERLWILHRVGTVAAEEEALRIGTDLAAGGSRELLEAVVSDRGAGPFALLLGCAGWGPLQVEHEVAAGAWVPLPLHEDLIFEVLLASRWEEAVRRLGLEPGGFSMGGGGAEA